MRPSLHSRLALSNLLLTLLGLAIITVVFGQLLAQRSTDIKQHDRAQDAQRVATAIERIYQTHASAADLQRTIDIAHQVLGAEILVINPHGRPVLDSNAPTPWATGTWHLLNRRALAEVQSSQRSLRRNPNLVLFQVPIRGTDGRNGGAVLLVARVTDVATQWASLAGGLLVAVLTALLVWFVIGLFFTTSISRPLLLIRQATERMAGGDYRVRVPVRGSGEIAQLAVGFNSMAEQVQQSNQVLKDFVGNVSHDLRTPLTMIAGFSEALLDGTARPQEVEEAATVIRDEAAKMQRLVDDLLQLTRLESGLLTLEQHPTSLHEFVQATIERVARSKPGAPIINEVPATLPAVLVDPQHMERVLRNLLDNALQHTPAHGTIRVSAAQLGAMIEISVADTGAGIPADDLPRVFERFYRSDRSRGRGEGNSGLGLAIVREIVEAHGGNARVESEVGIGSTFRFTVPLADPRPARAVSRHPVGMATR